MYGDGIPAFTAGTQLDIPGIVRAERGCVSGIVRVAHGVLKQIGF